MATRLLFGDVAHGNNPFGLIEKTGLIISLNMRVMRAAYENVIHDAPRHPHGLCSLLGAR